MPAAVLIDLDSTLLNSTEQRSMALVEALNELTTETEKRDSALDNDYKLENENRNRALAVVLTELATETEQPTLNQLQVAFFNKYIYDLWKLYAKLELGNFRQVMEPHGMVSDSSSIPEKSRLT